MHCAACGSQRLSPPAVLRTNQGTVDAYWQVSGESGWFKSGVVCRGRTVIMCGDCGYFMLFADPATLADALAKWAQLATPDR